MTDTPFIGYPEGWLLAIVDDRTVAEAAATDIEALGVARDDMRVLSGERAAEAVDATGSEHGVFSTILRGIERSLSDVDHLTRYEQALHDGAAVLAIYAESDELRGRAVELLTGREARYANYFGTFTVETLVR
ncbi:MAG: hypothetical protein R3C39_10435 [Dehalococcoidia bacterium]